jgi:nucleoid DNA-binding protein
MTVEELGARVQSSTGLPPEAVEAVLKAVVAELKDDLRRFRLAELPSFATFRLHVVSPTPARKGINPFTKESLELPAKPGGVSVRARPHDDIKHLAEQWYESDELGPPLVDERYGDIRE